MFNEAGNIPLLLEKLKDVLQKIGLSYELICVNDGSGDSTLLDLIAAREFMSELKIINLSRNFGKEIALTAGLHYSSGNAVIPIDADLQDPPEIIIELVNKWQEGFDVVYAQRIARQGESWLKRFTAWLFYGVIKNISKISIPSNTGDFRLIDRSVVDAINRMPERSRFMKGLFAWVGFNQTAIYFHRPPRHAGTTKWNYWKLWNLALDGITSFSLVPLKIWSYLGLITALLSFLYAFFIIFRTIILGIDIPGYASLMVALLFLSGIQMFGLGILGEYLGRVYEEVKERPLYLVRNVYGFDENNKELSNISKV
jgi:glycosyltransferase involved in cell wall biosynthesis